MTTATITARDARAWNHGYDTGHHVGLFEGQQHGYKVGYTDGHADGIPVGRLQVEDELAIAGRPILDAIAAATGQPLHRLEPFETLQARRSGVPVPKPTKPAPKTRLAPDWERHWLAGAPSSRYLEETA